MTTPPEPPALEQGRAPYDMDSQVLMFDVPAELTLSVLPTPNGQRAAATIRTTSATVTVFLTKELAETWRDNFIQAVAGMNGLILPPGAHPASPVNH